MYASSITDSLWFCIRDNHNVYTESSNLYHATWKYCSLEHSACSISALVFWNGECQHLKLYFIGCFMMVLWLSGFCRAPESYLLLGECWRWPAGEWRRWWRQDMEMGASTKSFRGGCKIKATIGGVHHRVSYVSDCVFIVTSPVVQEKRGSLGTRLMPAVRDSFFSLFLCRRWSLFLPFNCLFRKLLCTLVFVCLVSSLSYGPCRKLGMPETNGIAYDSQVLEFT